MEEPPAKIVYRAKKPYLHSSILNTKIQDYTTSKLFYFLSLSLIPFLPPLTLANSKTNYLHPQIILEIELDSKEEKSLFINLGYDETVVDTELVKENL